MFRHTITKPRPGITIDRANPYARGLAGMWLFNEGVGSSVRDLVTGQLGTLTNFALTGTTSNWVATATGGGINTDGSNDVITIPNNSGLRGITDQITIIARVKIISLARSFNQILMKNNANTTYFGMLVNSSGKLQCQIVGTTTSVATLTVGNTYECACTWNKAVGGGLINVYINGRFDTGTTVNTTALATGTSNLSFGSDAVNANRQGAYTFDHVRIYNRVLSPAEISQLYFTPYLDLLYPKTYYRIGVARSYGYIIG